ncbi:class Ib ribonucleoside-diphosphate reductase assembly flavoprotein NrdI [Pedobacter cryoconitis]|uniref:Protein involved in ribonucleotide reduction n=1 Tax=Pedobacter cryoconitis TaxID=188932 RepID=A0A7X0J0N3_9SPHI|nr:class Ib ribonucleoside-diphosphate reductase assembly flavoprotein NrdI [Pedobacter cryoconitis]MBB6498914.1 protein involved in ribonucleotide reduction [Pedobacter cryoconitis]
MTWIYYDSKTGNVERFVNRLKLHRDWSVQKIDETLRPLHEGHLITYTTGFGEIPLSTQRFLDENSSMIKSVSSSGNKNWGPNYAMAATKIADRFKLPVLMQFELSGTLADIQKFIDKIEG